MLLSALLAGMEILRSNVSGETEITGVSYDSRKVRPGHLYVAIAGYQDDGHRYIADALRKGASAVLCQTLPEGEGPFIQVADSRAALADLGGNWYGHPSQELCMVGVTGTNGKTTVTCLLKTVLEQTLGAKVGLIGTIENMIGDQVVETERTTPESFDLQGQLRRMADAGCTHVVMEVSSHALYLHRVRGISYRVGVFTNLTEDHLDFHETMENYRLAKQLLFDRCETGVFNLDDPAAGVMMAAAPCPCLTCSMEQPADIRGSRPALLSDRVEMDVTREGKTHRLQLGIPGKFSCYNALSVVGAACALGIDPAQTLAALKTARGVKGRVEVVPTPGKDYTVLIDYAHTPDGLENVLSSVKGYCRGRLIAVFGCGGDRDPYKRPVMGKIGVDIADLVVFTSDNPRTEDPHEILRQIVAGTGDTKTPYVVMENRRAAIRWAMDHARKDDIIVLAGKGHETYQILGTEKTHLDEREEVAAHLAGN